MQGESDRKKNWKKKKILKKKKKFEKFACDGLMDWNTFRLRMTI
jgi:hypothetical protein